MANRTYHSLRLILGDQLNPRHSWLQQRDEGVLYLVAELRQETDYVRHHVQKLCAFFAAMQVFAEALRQAGHRVCHLTLDDTRDDADLPALLRRLCRRHGVRQLQYQLPDEYRLRQQLADMPAPEGVQVEACSSEHFLLDDAELGDWIKPGRHNRMETFYRRMRRRFDILMEDGQPLGGQWNFDADNRKTLKSADIDAIPAPLLCDNPVGAILERLRRHRVDSFGTPEDPLGWPVSRRQARRLLDHFCQHALPHFGRYQDAMSANADSRWALYHSRLSFALNSKMLHPMEVIGAVVTRWRAADGAIELAQAEGFVRQILGWREYVRAVYWVNMPAYGQRNRLLARRGLPQWFWDGDTRMHCLRHSIQQSLRHAYAHHIQRLMITGNFCLLAGIDPDQVDAWYLGIYIDALEWVELPNTRGMSQFADGGLVATKPYAASGNYIHKMSDYCADCHYRVQERSGERACPFNSLYWEFLERQRERLQDNPRLAMIYRSWAQRPAAEREEIVARGRWCREHLEQL